MTAQAVLFDVGRVLIHPHERHFRRAVEEVCGTSLPGGVALRALAQTVWSGAGHTTPVEFWTGELKARTWAEHAGLPGDAGVAIWSALDRLDTAADPLWDVLDAEAEQALTELHAAGLRLAAVSNGKGVLHRDLARHGIGRFFDSILDSALEGVAKPAPEAFQRAAERLGVPLRSCVFIGDDPHFDVAASLRAGVGWAVLVDHHGLRPPEWASAAAASLAEAARLVVSDVRERRVGARG